jgi:hypothetical protein
MVEEEKDTLNLVNPSTINEQEQRHPQGILQTISSTIDSESSGVPEHIIDVFDEIYSNRTHQKCISISYCTLLSMTLSVIFWISYWLTYNRCQNLDDPQIKTFLCDLVIILENLTFISLGISPFLFIFTIYSWIRYSCYNSIDSIRENCIKFKIEGNQWKKQLDYYYNKKKIKCSNCFRRKQRKELYERSYGYIILSSHGIIIDELILLSDKKYIIDNGILLDNNKLLKLTFKKMCTRPWKSRISIYLPENPINQYDMEKLRKLFQIQTNNDDISLSYV